MTASICDIEIPADNLETLADQSELTEERRQVLEATYDMMYRLYARPLLRYLLRLTLGDYREAEDYLQETFLRTWRWLQEHTIDPEITRPWLYTVARRIVIDGLRARQARPAEVPATNLNVLSQPDNDIEHLVQVHALRSAMLSLSPQHSAALVELFYHERTAKEAAEVLGIPEGTVKSRAHYALQALRQATEAGEWEAHEAGRLSPALANRQPARRTPAAKHAAEGGPTAARRDRSRPAAVVTEAPAAA